MLLAHKIELRPTPEQMVYLDKACGSKRHCYNQLLAHFSKPENKWSKNEAYQHYINVLRKEFDWYNEVSSRVTRNAIDDLDTAFKHFFRRVKAKQKAGFPRFKKKDLRDSFALRESAKFDVIGRELRIEKLKTKIELRQPLRFQGIAKQVTISKRAGKYFASILVETEDYNPHDVDRQHSVGVDFGIKSLAVLSIGKVFSANQKLKASLKKLAKLQRNLTKKVKWSNRRAKAKLAIVKLHFRIARQRQALLHELSDYLTKNFDVITIEDLNVKGMLKNRKLSRAISDAGFGYLRQMIEYKAKLRNCVVVVANRFFPSSKTCSCCGKVKTNLSLADRTFTCECGFSADRDLNAALNLNQYGLDTLQPDLKCTPEQS
ncbi:RNA-guided endonuclease InsQ/TnpB family protein [Chromatium okenii]|uniref:Transposase n=1 Tax=Chromatium okenii TaxID=61644 RepID=A0A2S7XN17_9GAMM|nr:RNA-guided endonuclease TnpB family protein [Chromatium okenii]PQJ95129.1 transposase [Chromatium okenii]